jgi:hypothetical protein
MLVTGTITGAMALQKSSKFKDQDTPYEDLQDLKDSGKTLKTVASVTIGIGAAAAVGTAVLYFFTDFGSKEKTDTDTEEGMETSVTAAPIIGGGMVTVGGRF